MDTDILKTILGQPLLAAPILLSEVSSTVILFTVFMDLKKLELSYKASK